MLLIMKSVFYTVISLRSLANYICNSVVILVHESEHTYLNWCVNVSFVFVFDFIAGCSPGRAEDPECIASEGADGGASQGGEVRADN